MQDDHERTFQTNLRLLSFLTTLDDKDKPSNTTTGITPAFFTEIKHFWKISLYLGNYKRRNFSTSKVKIQSMDQQLKNISHLSRLPLWRKDTLNPLCCQQDALIAAIWPASSQRFMFLTNLQRRGRDRESPLRIQYWEMFTRPRQEANDKNLSERPACNAIIVCTPPALLQYEVIFWHGWHQSIFELGGLLVVAP